MITNFVQQYHIPGIFKDWFLCIVMILILFGFLFGLAHATVYVSSLSGFDLELSHALTIIVLSFIIYVFLNRRIK